MNLTHSNVPWIRECPNLKAAVANSLAMEGSMEGLYLVGSSIESPCLRILNDNSNNNNNTNNNNNIDNNENDKKGIALPLITHIFRSSHGDSPQSCSNH